MNKYQEALDRISEAYYNLDGSLSAMKRFFKDIDLIQHLIDKQTPKEPILYTDVIHEEERNIYECPNCASFLGYENECKEEYYQSIHCSWCGQKLDWSKVND